MAANRPTLPARTIALAAILLAVLLFGGAVHAQPSHASTSGPNAFAVQAKKLHDRLQVIAMQTPPGKYPLGTGLDGVLRFSSGWTSGFWAGALWRDWDLAPDTS